MWNYHQITTEAEERQRLFLDLAEQRRLAQSIPAQPHPLLVWIGQQLIGWGHRLQAAKSPADGVTIPATLLR